MAIALEHLICEVVAGQWTAALTVGERPAELEVAAEGGRVVWRIAGLVPAAPPARHAKSRLVFALDKAAFLEQCHLFPPAQAAAATGHGLESPITGKERWAGHSRPVDEPIGRYPLTRIFVACPDPAGFVADTPVAPSLELRWSAAEGGRSAQLSFEVEPDFDAAPDRRWQEPALEIDMSHQGYADLMAALAAVA